MEAGSKSPCSCHILIVGAGLAGLASALALHQAGHRITVLERMAELGQVRPGISTVPHTVHKDVYKHCVL